VRSDIVWCNSGFILLLNGRNRLKILIVSVLGSRPQQPVSNHARSIL
jgi:hypothetical protein